MCPSSVCASFHFFVPGGLCHLVPEVGAFFTALKKEFGVSIWGPTMGPLDDPAFEGSMLASREAF